VATNEPFVYDINKGRAYYGNSIRRGGSEELWTDHEFQSGYDVSHPFQSKLLKAGISAGAYGLFRAAPGHFTKAARFIEDVGPLPFKWGRTFQLSNMMSHRETAVTKAMSDGVFFRGSGTGKLAGHVNSDLASYLADLTDKRASAEEFQAKGFSLKDGKLYLGNFKAKDAREVLAHAEVIRMSEGSSNTSGEAYARTNIRPRKVPNFSKLKSTESVQGSPGKTRTFQAPTIEGMPIQVVGAQTKFQATLNRTKAFAAQYGVYRFNSLLRDDFKDNPLTKGLAAKLNEFFPTVFGEGLGVKPTTPLRTLGGLTKKLGLLTVAAPMAYQQADWAVEQVLGFGPTKAIASAYVGARMAYSHVLDTLDASIIGGGDMYDLQDWFEETSAGSTSPWNIAKAFGGGFVFGSVAIGLTERTQAILYAKNFKGEGSLRKAREVVDQQFRDFGAGRKDLAAPLGTFSEGVIDFARRFGTAQEASPGLKASYFEDSSSFVGKLWKKLMMKEVADTKSPVHPDTKPVNLKLLGRATTTKIGGFFGGVAGLLYNLPNVIGGIVGLITPDERPEELEAIYSGRKEVAVKKGRFWEFGRSDIEGEEVLYYRPHWYSRMMSNYKEEAIWGEEADFSPLRKSFLKNFTYHLENKHFYDRPYPVTSLPFNELPVGGELVGQTLGRIVKPVKLMHSDEWKDGDSYRVAPAERGKSYALDLGETPGGVPDDPNSFKRTFGTVWNQFSQQAGLLGFVGRVFTKSFTGTEGVFDQGLVMESFGKVTSHSRDFYDLQLGNAAGMLEGYRRLYPVEGRGPTPYNPIKNTMPGWLPGAGSRSINFQQGDPYTKIKEGEYRLPGRGYAARFEELEGVDPNDYPLIHKYKILADVAPYSQEFIGISEQAKSAAKSGDFDSYEQSIYDSTEEQLKIRGQKKQFSEYKNRFGDQDKYGSNSSKGLLATLNESIAGTEERGIVRKLFGAWSEQTLHHESPLDQLFPISPGAKFNKRRTAIEDYEADQLYGNSHSEWNKPIDDFISPTVTTTLNRMGSEGIPGAISSRRELEAYFDVLKYVKNTRLANIAALNEDEEARVIFERRKDQTLFGMNPYTSNDRSVMRSLPGRDRDYYEAFSNASTAEERERVLEMVPKNQRNLYIARWKLKYVEDLKTARDQDMLFGFALEKASDEINAVYQEARSEGFPSSPELHKAFMESKHPGENYADWYRRTQMLSDVPLPGADWIGWNPSVDLEDVKLKTVLDLGEDMHDYNLWPAQLSRLASKPYINDEAVSPILNRQRLSQSQMISRLEDLFLGNQLYAQIESRKTWGFTGTDSVSVELEQ
jgi:hypothetical protein